MEAEALFREAGLKGVSYFSFYFVLKQMQKLKFKGLPYIDAKTFQGWVDNGYKVKKGEKSAHYLDTLQKLADTMKVTAKCGLGQSVANSFSSIVDNFKEEMIY